MADMRIYDGQEWVKVADLDMPPDLIQMCQPGNPQGISYGQFVYAVLEHARKQPRALVCRYCGSALETYHSGGTGVDAFVWIECASMEGCRASWQPDGKQLTDQNGVKIDA